MTADTYIRLVIRTYTVKKEQADRVFEIAKELYPAIKIWANNILGGIVKVGPSVSAHTCLLGIRPIGSFAKGTSIIGGTDLDLFISLNHTTPGTLGEIYNSLYDYLKICRLPAIQQNVSIGVNYKGLHIDLVPAKKQSGPTSDHSIYRRKSNTWTKTNVYKHISYVRNKGRLNEILATKIWRQLHRLEFPSFYLELSVIEALKGHPLGKLPANFVAVLDYLSSNFENARIPDPENTNNVVSDDLTMQEKQTIAQTALENLTKSSLDQIIW